MSKEKLLYPELSYQIMGVLFEVHNKLGTKYQEKHYQNAVETKLKELNISYKRENKGEFYVDFIIDNKIILELKKVWKINQDDVSQVLRYLDALNLRLGIVANFRHKRLEYRRILN